MRRLIAWIFGWRVVALQDYDGEVVFRLAEPDPFGGMMAWRMSRAFRIGRVVLRADGTVGMTLTRASYVKRWVQVWPKA